MKQSRPLSDLDQQFMQGMDDISIATESDFQDIVSDQEHEQLQREERQKALERNKLILQELKNGVNMDNALINQFQQGFHGIVEVTRGQKDTVMSPQIVEEIKKKVSKTAPQIVLAEDVLVSPPPPPTVHDVRKQTSTVDQKQEVSSSREESRLRQKMDKMFQERQLIEMARCDGESMKYEEDFHSNLLSIRFYTPKLKTVQSSAPPILVVCPEPAYTYTNLQPQANNEGNVLSKHSKVLAFRALAELARPRATVTKFQSQTITFTKVQHLSTENPQHNQLAPALGKPATKSNQIFTELKQHYSLLATTIRKLEQASKDYQPRLLKQHLETHQKGLNADLFDDAGSEKSLRRFIEAMENPSRAKEIRVTFEKLRDLNGIDTLPAIEYASLQFNCLTVIDGLAANHKLIEVDLASNRIAKYSCLSKLKWLRYIDLERNQVEEMAPLVADNLEVLILRHNKIADIRGLDSARNLRRLDLSNNNVQNINGLDNLCFLDELNIAYNRLTKLQGIGQCLLLRKLDLSNNRLKSMDRLIMMFLNELDLRNNQLEQLASMIMPSLQTFYLTDNRLAQVNMQTQAYLPNLRLLNLDRNRLTGYAPVWHLLRYSTKLSIVKYDDNEELSLLPDKVRELYQHIIYRRKHRLSILNQSEFSIGLKRYYESLYEQLLNDQPSTSPQDSSIRNIEAKIELTLHENRLLSELEASKDPFNRQPEFVWLKSVKVAGNLLQIQRGLALQSLQLTSCDSVFHRLDCFRMRYERSLHKLRSLLVKWKYRKAKRAKYYRVHRETIKKQLGWMTVKHHQLLVMWAVGKFRQMLAFGVGHQQAIKIQKVWRGYALRKKFRRLIERIRMPSAQDDFLVEDVDEEFFMNPDQFDFELKIPDTFDFGGLVIKPNVFKAAEVALPEVRPAARLPQVNNNQDRLGVSATSMQSVQSGGSRSDSRRDTVELPRINMRQAPPPPLPPVRRREQEEQRVMQQWGFKNPETVAMMRKKAEKKRKTMQKQLQKNMTAEQRLQRFKRM